MVADASAMAVVVEHLPMSFTNNGPGMLLFAEALLPVGKSVRVDKKIDAGYLLSCTSTITTPVQSRVKEIRQFFVTNDIAGMWKWVAELYLMV